MILDAFAFSPPRRASSAMPIFEDLSARDLLLCPEHHRALRVRGGRLVCEAGGDFGPLEGPLDFLRTRGSVLDTAAVPRADVERLRRQLELPDRAEVNEELARAIAATGLRFDASHLSAEARMLAERFRIPEFEAALGADRPSALARIASAVNRVVASVAPGERRLQHVSDSIGERLTCGQEVYRSVRVRNAGALLEPDAATRIETHWTTPEGARVPGCAVATQLPVAIEPGREITLIVRVRAPETPGRYRLHVQLEGASGAFLESDLLAIRCELPVFEYRYFPDLLEYGADHHVAMLEAAQFLSGRFPGGALLLEIGGGVNPTGHALAARGHRVVSADVSHSQSLLGTLYYRHHMPQLRESLAFLSCEGTGLPFADASFDGVMLFAAFHHFADPPALLREARRVTRSGGVLFLGCETCAPEPSDPQYRDELRRGINEQMWTLVEFSAFFREAGLQVASARVDGHSLKVGLVRP